MDLDVLRCLTNHLAECVRTNETLKETFQQLMGDLTADANLLIDDSTFRDIFDLLTPLLSIDRTSNQLMVDSLAIRTIPETDSASETFIRSFSF